MIFRIKVQPFLDGPVLNVHSRDGNFFISGSITGTVDAQEGRLNNEALYPDLWHGLCRYGNKYS